LIFQDNKTFATFNTSEIVYFILGYRLLWLEFTETHSMLPADQTYIKAQSFIKRKTLKKFYYETFSKAYEHFGGIADFKHAFSIRAKI
jgi:hypothetical protein